MAEAVCGGLPLGLLSLLLLVLVLLPLPPGQAQQQPQQRRLVGGVQEASADEEGARRALQFAMNEYNRGSNDKYASRVAEVVRVRKQIVSGVNYFFDVKVGRTTCPKSVADVENCAFHEAPELAKHVTCSFQVYSVPWLNQISLRKNNCT